MFGLVTKEDLNQVGISEKSVEELFLKFVEFMKVENEEVRNIVQASEKKNTKHLSVIETQVTELKNDEVTTQSLKAFNACVTKKAKELVTKNGIQLSIESVYDPRTMTVEEKLKINKAFEESYNKDVGKVKQTIKSSVKKYLGMKGNAPDKTLKQIDMDLADKYVRSLKAKDVF